jgi:hypothetical protein
MKKQILLSALLILIITAKSLSQQEQVNERETVVYSVIINIVPDSFNFPLIGFINIAKGNQQNPQIGFINANEKDLSGVQVSYVNTVGGDFMGLQVGFINTVASSVMGPQIGFINTCGGDFQGVQSGFINTVANEVQGVQAGFINTIGGNFQGVQVGFVNTTAGDISGAEIGFINSAKKLNGLQLGFINYADTVENGIPIGFLSVVRKGGFRAFELSANEMYPANFAFKIGVRRFYTSFNLVYNENLNNRFATGFGMGSIIDINERSFINPELTTYSSLQYGNDEWDFNQLSKFNLNFGYNLNYGFSLFAGPTFSWQYNHMEQSFMEPLFSIYERELSNKNRFHIGVSLGLRYELCKK